MIKFNDYKSFDDFVRRECPKEGGCLLIEVVEPNKKFPKHLCIERHRAMNGDIFLVGSSHMHYDWTPIIWKEENEITILYKKEV